MLCYDCSERKDDLVALNIGRFFGIDIVVGVCQDCVDVRICNDNCCYTVIPQHEYKIN